MIHDVSSLYNRVSTNYQAMFDGIIDQTHAYLMQYPNIESFVLGVSGGIDSTLCAALARVVCRERSNLKLIGYSLPSDSNKNDENLRAQTVGVLCDDFEIHNIEDQFMHMIPVDIRSAVMGLCFNSNKEYQLNHKDKVRLGNIKARIRMMHLFDVAQVNNGLVLSTDNQTELLLGFWTLHGDVGNFGMIQELWKTEVFGLTEWLIESELLNEEEQVPLRLALNAVPTDGLGITNSDLDQLLPEWSDMELNSREAYELVDHILQEATGGSRDPRVDDLYGKGTSIMDTPIIKRSLATEFKRNDPFNIPRCYLVPSLCDQIGRKVK